MPASGVCFLSNEDSLKFFEADKEAIEILSIDDGVLERLTSTVALSVDEECMTASE